MPREARQATPALLRVKTLIWVQSVTGAAFATAFVAGMILKRESVCLSALGLLVLWAFGLIPIHRQGWALLPRERVEGREVPSWALLLWTLVEVVGFWSWGLNEWMGIVMLAHGWLAATVFLRAILSQSAGVPIHGASAVWVILVAAAAFLWYGFVLALVASFHC